MEGDRILRGILNKGVLPSLTKDVENYLSPMDKFMSKQQDATSVMKYHAFSLKLLRCCIQGFENSKSEIIHLLEVCKVAVTCLGTTCKYFTNVNNIESCQLERLIKLLYHFLAYLNKVEDFERFLWFSGQMMNFCKLQGKKSEISDLELSKMYEKVFEMHWTLGGKMIKSKQHSEAFYMRIHGILFVLEMNKDLAKVNKYLESCMLNFMQENKDGNQKINPETSLLITDVIKCVYDFGLSPNSGETVKIKGLAIYAILLSYKLLLVHGDSKDCLQNLSQCVNSKSNGGIKNLFLVLIEAYRTNLSLRGCTNHKLKKELCKQANSVKQYLNGFETIHEELVKSKLLIANPKIILVYDILKLLLTFKEVLCWDILTVLAKFATSLKKHMDLLQMSVYTEIQNSANKKGSQELKNILGILLTHWYSFCCWCLQVFQLWLTKDGKSKADIKCTCTARSSHNRADLFDYCCNLNESASKTLQLMKDTDVEYRESEHRWIGVASYNFAILAQKETSLKIAVKLFVLSIENLKLFVQSAHNGTDQNESEARIQQVNLMTKNKLLVDLLLKAGHADKALSQIAGFLRFLLDVDSFDIDSKTIKELIRDQVNLWINTKEKLSSKDDVTTSLLTKEFEDADDSLLKVISEIEFEEIKAKRYPSWIKDAQDLLSFVIERFEETDNMFVSWALLEYATLPSDIINLSKRMKLCNEAIVLLEEETARDEVTNRSQDLLAMAYFYLGCFQHKSVVVKSRSTKQGNKDSEMHEGDDSNGCPSKLEESESIDYIASFNTSLDIWTLLIQTVFTDKNPSMVEETFRFLDKTSSCLLYIGIVYSLHRQKLNAVHALHLTALLAELNAVQIDNSLDTVHTRLHASFEMSRLLTALFDLPSAINVLSKDTALTTSNSSYLIQRQITEASLLTRAGEHQKAQSILENTLCDKVVLQKTPKSFFLKADALLVFALCQEYPGNTANVQDHHPLVIAQEALKILRNLLALYLDTKDEYLLAREPSSSKHKNGKQELMSVTPWIVLDRLLDCLLYIAQRYKMQGCIPEARCHIKEGLVLCDEFSLNERKSEFFIEEAEAGIISNEADKAEKALKEVSQILQDKTMNNSIKNEIPPFHRHVGGCTCEFCADFFLPKVCLNCLILRRKLTHIKTGNVDCQAKRVSIEEVLKSAMEKAKSSLKDLRAVLTLGTSKKKKKVTFEDQDVKENDSKMTESFKDSCVFDLDAAEITKLNYSAKKIELICLDCKDAARSTADKMLQKLDLALREMRSSKHWALVCRNFRMSVVMILQQKADLLLKSESGIDAVDLLWNVISDKVCSDLSKQDCKVDGSLKCERTEAEDEAACQKPKRSQKKSTRGRKAKGTRKTAKSSGQNEEHGELNNGRSCIFKKEEIQGKDEVIKNLSDVCFEALSLLVSDLDCMLIKKFYQILGLISGYRDIHQTVFLEQLAFSRSLHQQLLVRTLKNIRKRSKDTPMTEKPAATNDRQLEMASSILQSTSDVFAFKNHQILNQQLADNLPKDWRICSLRLSNIGKRCLIITRLQAGREPLLLRIPIIDQEDDELEDSAVGGLVRDLASAFVTDPLEELEQIFEQSLRSLETEDVKSWWNNRKKLDAKLKRTLAKIEDKWLGHWKGILLGSHSEVGEESKLDSFTEEICKKIREDCCVDLQRSIVKMLLDSYPSLNRMQVKKAFQNLLAEYFTESVLEVFIEKAEEVGGAKPKSESFCTPVKGRKSRKAQAKCDEVKQVKRGPVILILDEELQKIPWESMSVFRDQIVSRMPSLVLTRLGLLTSNELVQNGVDVTKTFYILNPRNDLQNTQKTFEKWFQREQGWNGISGRAPTETEYKSALEDHDLFIYCGHGNGREFLRGDDIQRITCKAVTLLMGCSSGKLQVKGRLDARGMALSYLMAGCPAIVANLWDVTDKDIDRFLTRLLKEWIEQRGNILNYVSTARDECFLPYLIGASPVVYGLPLVCQFN